MSDDPDRKTASDPIQVAYEHCLSRLRTLDRDRYLACLLTPPEKRGPLAALYLFNAEIARIRDVVREPMAGEVRMQWWRDVITGHGTEVRIAEHNPAAEALLDTIRRFRLPPEAFAGYLEARSFDLYDDAMPDRTNLEGYAGETASRILQLAAMICDRDAAVMATDATGHAGVAQTVAGMLLLMPQHTARGQLYVPAEMLQACGLDRETFLSGEESTRAQALWQALAAFGQEHLETARAAHAALPASLFPAFLPVAFVQPVLDRAARAGAADFRRRAPRAAQWRRQLRLLMAAWRGRF